MARRPMAVLPLLQVLALVACGGDDPTGVPLDTGGTDAGDTADVPDGSGDGITVTRFEFELSEAALVVEGALLAGLTDYDGAGTHDVVFAADTEGIEALDPGRVLVAGMSTTTPSGLLRRVDSVESVGDQVVVHTGPASLPHAFRRIDLEMSGTLPGGEVFDSAAAKASAGDSASETFGGEVDWIVFDGDGDPTTDEDQVFVRGLVEASIGFSFVFSYDLDVLGDIDPFEIPPDLNPVDVDLRFDFDIDLGATVDIEAGGRSSLSYEKEVQLGYLPLGAFGIGPLVFTPILEATGRIEGGATGEFVVSAGFDATFGGGLDFSVDDGFSPSIATPTFAATEPGADLEIGAHARASVDIELALLLYGIIGPKAGLEVWAGVDANIHDDPCWRASVGIDAIVGVLIELFSVELADWDHRWPLGETEVGSGSCPTGETFDPPPPWSVALGEALSYVFSPDRATTRLSRAIDGNLLVCGQGSRGLYKLTPDGNLVWARAFRDTDSTLEDLFRVTVVAPRLDTGLLAATDADALLWLDAGGRLEAARRLDVGSTERLVFDGAVTIADGTVLLSTPVRPVEGSPRDVAVLRVRTDGTIDAWQWGDPAWDDIPHALVPWGSGFALVVTSQNFSATPDTVSWLLVLDADGALAQAWSLSPCSGDEELALRAAIETEDGHLVLGGYQRFSAPRAAFVNVDPEGNVDWTTLNSTSNLLGYEVTGMAQLPSGSWLATGSRSYAAPNDVFVARTDSAGRFIWVRTLGGDSDEEAAGVLASADGSAIVAAPTGSIGDTDAAWWLSRLDVRDGVLEFDAGQPVRAYDDEFTPQDACVASTAGSTVTTPLPVAVSDTPATEELAPGAWQRLQ